MARVETSPVSPVARRRSLEENDDKDTSSSCIKPKKARADTDETRREELGLVQYIKDNVRIVLPCAGNSVFHGGAISAENAKKADFEKGRCTWFAFDYSHSQDYGNKSPSGTLTEYRLKRSLVLLDFRPTSYEPRATKDGSDVEDDDEGDDEGLFLGTFDPVHELACERFGATDDTDFAEKLRHLNHKYNLGVDGLISFDYGVFAELVLFDANEGLLEYVAAIDPRTTPQRTGHSYARNSLLDEVFETLDINDLEAGDVRAHALIAEEWNRNVKTKPISVASFRELCSRVSDLMWRLAYGV